MRERETDQVTEIAASTSPSAVSENDALVARPAPEVTLFTKSPQLKGAPDASIGPSCLRILGGLSIRPMARVLRARTCSYTLRY